MSDEATAYALKFLPGKSFITRVVVTDRTLGVENWEKFLEYGPARPVDRLVYDYIKNQVGARIVVERARNSPSLIVGFPADPDRVMYRTLPAGTIYVTITRESYKIVEGTETAVEIPGILVAGSERDIGSTIVSLKSAPGDTPCPGYCRTPEQAFAAIRGRVSALVIRLQRSNLLEKRTSK